MQISKERWDAAKGDPDEIRHSFKRWRPDLSDEEINELIDEAKAKYS